MSSSSRASQSHPRTEVEESECACCAPSSATTVQERQSAPYPFEPRRLSFLQHTSHLPHFPFSNPKSIFNNTTNQTVPPHGNVLSSPPKGDPNDSISAASSSHRQSVLANRVGVGRKLAGFRTNITEITVLFAQIHPPTLAQYHHARLRFLALERTATSTEHHCGDFRRKGLLSVILKPFDVPCIDSTSPASNFAQPQHLRLLGSLQR